MAKMLRRTALWMLFSKPVTQGYISQLPPPPSVEPGRKWMHAFHANSEVKSFFTPNAERYEEWYKETYGLEDLSDGCAASGASSNRALDDTLNLQRQRDEYDLEGVEEEMEYWSKQKQHNYNVK